MASNQKGRDRPATLICAPREGLTNRSSRRRAVVLFSFCTLQPIDGPTCKLRSGMIASESNASPQKRRRGRPSIRTRQIEDAICCRIAFGESLRQICRDPKMPCRDTIFRWLRKDKADAHARARLREFVINCLARPRIDFSADRVPAPSSPQTGRLD